MNAEYKYSARNDVFDRTGYTVQNKIATTLQGSIYYGTHDIKEPCVLKRACIKLHKNNAGIMHNQIIKVNENIVKEAKILKYLTSLNGNIPGLTKFIDFWNDDKNFFLIMEYGGESLFQHIMIMHKNIRQNKLQISIWKEHVKILFKQMCLFINWLHNAKICHLDISLENLSIKGCEFENGKFISHGQIYLIDYGLAKCFGDKKSFKRCKKYVGKHCYQAPKVYHKIPYNAFKADIWSLGIILFMMTFGCGAYNIPTTKDGMFVTLYSGNIKKWSKEINKSKHSSKLILDILSNIFCDEQDRWTINDIIEHKYIK